MSHPVWVCGLKHTTLNILSIDTSVTPCMGVWIETPKFIPPVEVGVVTPCMGVWIETLISL